MTFSSQSFKGDDGILILLMSLQDLLESKERLKGGKEYKIGYSVTNKCATVDYYYF